MRHAERGDRHGLLFDTPAVYPEYLSDLNVLMCPSDTEADAVANGAWNTALDPQQPYDLCRVGDLSYIYISWVFRGEHDYIRAGHSENEDITDANLFTIISANFIAKIMQTMQIAGQGTAIPYVPADPKIHDADMAYVHEDHGPTTAYRLREGVERFMITDINNPAATALAQSEVAYMCDFISPTSGDFNHIPGGSNVLYMDGHVAFVRYPTQFPCSRAWMKIIEKAGI